MCGKDHSKDKKKIKEQTDEVDNDEESDVDDDEAETSADEDIGEQYSLKVQNRMAAIAAANRGERLPVKNVPGSPSAKAAAFERQKEEWTKEKLPGKEVDEQYSLKIRNRMASIDASNKRLKSRRLSGSPEDRAAKIADFKRRQTTATESIEDPVDEQMGAAAGAMPAASTGGSGAISAGNIQARSDNPAVNRMRRDPKRPVRSSAVNDPSRPVMSIKKPLAPPSDRNIYGRGRGQKQFVSRRIPGLAKDRPL